MPLLPIVLALALPAGGPSDLQARIDRAQNHSTVTIGPGEYLLSRPLRIQSKTGLTVKFLPGARVLLDDVNQDVVQITASTKIVIDGGYFSHKKPLTDYACHGNVFSVDGGSDITIKNADINGSGAVGVKARGVKKLRVEHCLLHENTFNAFYFDSCDGIAIKANRIENNKNLMQAYRVTDLEMSDNLIENNGGYWGAKDPRPGILR